MNTNNVEVLLRESEELGEAILRAAHAGNAGADAVHILTYENEVPPFLGKILDEL